MKIIFDNVDELIAFIRSRCPGDVDPYIGVNDCTTDYDYDPVTCEKCWRKHCEFEVKEAEPVYYNYNGAIKYIHAHTNLDKNVIDIILKAELDYMKSIGIAYELNKENDI